MSSQDFTSDVFISYSHYDEAWVQQWLLPHLESAGLQVFIDFRDFQPGAPSVTEMERAVLSSRKTLLVLSPAYIASDWAEFENVLAQTLDPAARRRRLLPILLERCEIPLRLKILNYLDFTEPARREVQVARLLASVVVKDVR